MLFVPGNNPSMVQNAGILGADTIIFDLEDAVAQTEKDSGRFLLKNALSQLKYPQCDITVRINAVDTPFWQDDLRSLVGSGIDGLVIPKVEKAEDINLIEQFIEALSPDSQLYFIPLIETAKGVEEVYAILQASDRIEAVFFGAEDYTANTGAKRTKEGNEIYYARSRIVNAAAACMVDAIDTPFTDVDDLDGLEKDTLFAKQLGFSGKAVISPRHCSLIKRVFFPSIDEIEYAKRVLDVVVEADKAGKGVISLDGKMIDKPIVMRAHRVLRTAGMGELINE